MMKIILLIISLTLLTGCTIKEESSSKTDVMTQGINQETIKFEKVNAVEAKELIDNNIILIDIRTPEEYAEERIEGSVNIDFYSKNFQDELNELDKTKPYLIYCRSSHRSGIAHGIMKDLGFNEVYDMTGGINEWKKTY